MARDDHYWPMVVQELHREADDHDRSYVMLRPDGGHVRCDYWEGPPHGIALYKRYSISETLTVPHADQIVFQSDDLIDLRAALMSIMFPPE